MFNELYFLKQTIMNVLEINGTFKFIFHLSDIHIRLNSRKEEYEFVFEELYQTLKKLPQIKESLIVITGDLLHNKIDLTPECILMSYGFLSNLGLIAPTFLIAGNHDALLNNRERIDSITCILHHRLPENVFYLKDSGYYQFGNVVFAVNSLLQENIWLDIIQDQKSNPKFFDKKMCIGLYHGQICGWKNNIGYASDSGDKSVDDFKGFDLILLGDIHKYQYMNSQKTMAYSGSLISQNFGETDPDHGVLCWNLSDKTSQFFRINNPYCYTEAVLENETLRILYYNSVLDWTDSNQLLQNIPSNTNMRVFMSQDKETNHNFCKAFKKTLPNARLQQKYSSAQNSSSSSSLQVQTQFNPDGSNEPFWIRTFVLEKLDGNPITLVEKLISDLQLEFRKNVLSQKRNTFTDWEIEEIKFDHLFGYGSSNIIHFNKLQSNTITGIFGKNSFGKSTIIDIISFLLFGKITRGTSGNKIPKEIINHLEKKAYGEIIFKVGNNRYKIIKNCSRQKNDVIKIVEQFFVYDGNQWKDHSEEHRKKTDKIVESLLGNVESFLFTNICLQQREKQFREMTQKDKKEFLYSLFGLDWFEKYRKDKEDVLKLLKGEEKVYREKIGQQSSQEFQEKNLQLKKNIETLTTDLNTLQETLVKIEQESDTLLKEQQHCVFSSKKQALQKKQELDSQLKENYSTETSVKEEITKLKEYVELYDLYQLKRDLENVTQEIKLMENCNEISCKNDPEIQKWVVLGTKEKWQSFYKKIQQQLEKSTEISSQWNDRKMELEKKILELECVTISYNRDFVCNEEWETLCSKMSKVEHDKALLEAKVAEEIFPEIDPIVEENIQRFYKVFHEFEMVQCKVQALKLQLKDTGKMEVNPDCNSCKKNLEILKQARQEKELFELETVCQQSLDKMKSIQSLIKQTWAHIPEKVSMESLQTFFITEIQRLKSLRNESIKKKETSQKKLTLLNNLIEKYNHTKNYRLFCENKDKIKSLKELLEMDHLKKEYEELLGIFSKNKVYQDINSYWEKHQSNSLSNLQEKQSSFLKTITKFEKRKQKVGELEKKEIDLKQSRILLDIELKNIEKQILILEKNESLSKHSQKLVQEKESTKALLEQKTKLLHSCQMDLEKIVYMKKEWSINMEKWKQCKETMDTVVLLLNCIDRDGLPLYLLKMYLPIIENEINQLVQSFFDKKLVLRVQDKEVVVGIESSSENALVSNYLGGMEAFMVDLSLKMVFSKFSRQPKSNFFIIDEGISVFDQERISNIGVLFNFLTSISEQVFLISHLPTIKDFVTQSIEIMKDSKGYSQVHCFF